MRLSASVLIGLIIVPALGLTQSGEAQPVAPPTIHRVTLQADSGVLTITGTGLGADLLVTVDHGLWYSVNRVVQRNHDDTMHPLNLVKLTALMDRTSGRPEVTIGLVDGPVVMQHPDLARESVRELRGRNASSCTQVTSAACLHGTFVAGILVARRTSAAPAICPKCTLIVRPLFPEMTSSRESMPSAATQELAAAIVDCVRAGARVINLSLAIAQPSTRGEQALEEAFNLAARRGVIVVAAAGNQGTLGSSAITRHPWLIPVVGCDLRGRPLHDSNLGSSIGRRGLSAPGEGVTSLGPDGRALTLGGTSVAVPFVSGTVALLWSEFPTMTAAQVKLAVTQPVTMRRASVVPPLLDAAVAYHRLSTAVQEG